MSKIHEIVSIGFRDLTTFGGSPFYALILLFSLIFREWSLASNLFWGFVFIMGVVLIIRIFYFKNRPRKQAYRNFLEKMDASSFPSWHTARVFFLAFIFSYFLQSTIAAIFLTAIACLAAYSRIFLKKHDWWDVLGGLVLAGITFWAVPAIANFLGKG